jgi:PIN domain nuclease of toxin-antitoxin system
MVLVLDTHTVIWYLNNSTNLSPTARTTIESAIRAGDEVMISAISLVELVYLSERREGIFQEALQMLEVALVDEASGLSVAPVDAAVSRALHKVSRDEVPEMPDRIIAATAVYLGALLVTRDRQLRSAGIQTVW